MMDLVLFFIMVMILLGYVFLQVRTTRARSGKGRWISLVPAAIILSWGVLILVSILIDPSAHNLWPFEMLMAALGGLLYLAVYRSISKAS